MGVIWSNTLKASNQSEAEKVLAYAKEHYKELSILLDDHVGWNCLIRFI